MFSIQPNSKLEIKKSEVDEYLAGNDDSLFNAKISAIKGSDEAEGKLTILGLEFSFEEDGHLGAIGATVEAGIGQGKLTVKAKVAVLFGIGFSVAVGLAD